MNKISVLFFVGLLLISFVSAQIDQLQENVDKLEDFGDEIPRDVDEVKDIGEGYLTQEWGKILEENKVGKFFSGISDFFKNFNFVFNFVFGIEYSLSWLFFLSLAFF